MPRVEENLAELMLTEHVDIPELIEALRQYVYAKGVDLHRIAVLITPFSRESAENHCDYVFGWIRKETESNLKSTSTLTLHPVVADRYILTSTVYGREFRNEIDLSKQIFAELLRNIDLDGSKIELEKPFASKIIVQLYADYREAIIDAYTISSVTAITEFYKIPVEMIAAGAGNDEINAYFEKARIDSEARRQADQEQIIANYNETEKEEYERFYAGVPSLKT